MSTVITRLALMVLVVVGWSLSAIAQNTTSTIRGRVLDVRSQTPLQGAVIAVRGTSLVAATDQRGEYLLTLVPSGVQTLEVSYLGFESLLREMNLTAGSTSTVNMVLGPAQTVTESITVVSEPILEGQAKALNQQLSALNIKNIVASDQIGSFPDPNAAEATQRIPGISIQRDQGEGRYVQIRGTEARLNSIMINGERISSPEGEVRSVALDVIPADLLDSIEVSKSLTPDMDGDAIGGAVNLVTRTAPSVPRLSISVGGGYNDLMDDYLQSGSLVYGRRFFDDRAGLMLSGSYLDTDRGSENFEVAYDDGELDELELRDYTVNRRRVGFGADFDYVVSDSTRFFVRGLFNEFEDQEFRRAFTNKVSDEALVRELKDRFESQQIIAASAGAEHLFTNAVQLDYRVGYSYAEEDEPDALYTVFEQEDVEFSPNVGPGQIDPNNIRANPLNQNFAEFFLDEIVQEDNFTSEDDLVGAVNVTVPLAYRPELGGFFKVGGKLRMKDKEQELSAFIFSPEEDIEFTGLIDPRFPGALTVNGRYDIGPFVGAGLARELLRTGAFESEFDFETDAGDFRASEDVLAGYGMAELYFGQKLTLVGGARYEYTDIDYRANEVTFDEEGDYLSTIPVEGSNSYGEVLPMLHLRYRVAQNTNLRAAVTRSLARPNYIQLAPSQIVLREDAEIERGNPDLKVTSSWNYDLMYETFFNSIGIFSAGVFYKSLDDYIYDFRFDEQRGGQTFEVIQPRNGESASILGVELAYQNQLRFLPAPFDGLGVYLNYTWTDSEAVFPDREGARSTLPGQSKNIGNFALSYEKNRWSVRAAANYHGRYIDEVGGDAAEDIYFDDHLQIDVSASVKLTPSLRFYVDIINLTDEPLRAYEGSSDRPIQEEYYSWWGTAGFKWTM